MRAFWFVICELELSKIWVCTGRQRIVMIFILGYFQQKVLTEFYETEKICPFMSVIYAHFIGNKNFSGKFAPVTFLISIMLFFQDRDGKI